MIALAIETATPACAAGLSVEGAVTSAVAPRDLHHTEFLAPALARLLEGAGLAPDAIERVVVDRGPGLYTGLRVGIATALGLAIATGAELVAVTSLEVLAEAARAAGTSGELLALVDGRRGEVFAQRFALGEGARPLDEPRVARPEAVAEELARRPATLAGDGALRYRERLGPAEVLDLVVPPVEAALAIGTARAPVAEVVPLYLREPDAVARFPTRTRAS